MSSSARKERKVVTVVFADLVGFTARAETLDPEDVEAILSPYHSRLRGELERFGGTVEKFIGDAVMAVFGAPLAREDDPERAVRAALAIRDWAVEQEGLEVRIAVATGEALVALDAQPESGEGMVAGDVVNTAARLQSAAPVNGVLVGETTWRATSTAIDYAEREPVSAKGKAQPVSVWEAIAARARFGVDPGQRGGGTLVGRDEELALLVDALTRARRERAPQLLTLVGVPGIGKSRLVYELFKSIERGTELTYWRQGRCLPYGEGVAFWALSEIAKAHAGILETDGAADAEAKLRRALAEILEEGADRDWVARNLRPLVGLAAESDFAGDRRSEAFAAWRRFYEALAEHRPLVLVIEDLHWADDGVLDFVDHLVEWATGVPILVVCTARPELLDRRPGWGGGKRASATVSLSPLSDDDTARLVHELLAQSVLPTETQSALLARAGGNPLYAEEFVRMVAERGHADGVLPESVQGIIAARLDLLDANEKELLQDAAVVGKVFWLGAVATLGGRERWAVEQALHALERRELVVRERRSSVAGENEYAFRHVLVCDVAYGQIPRAARGERHVLAAGWIEGLSPERAEDRSEMLAHHYLSALELARATGADTSAMGEQARRAFRDAGDRSFALNAFPSASRYFAAALELWPEDAERPRLLLALGRARWHAEESGETELAAARDAFEATGDMEGEAEAVSLLAIASWTRGDHDGLTANLDRVAELLPDLPDGRAKATVLSQSARLRALGYQPEQATLLAEEALALAERLGLNELKAYTLNNLSIARVYDGDLVGAHELLERAAEIARAERSPELLRVLNNLLVTTHRLDQLHRHDEVLDEFQRVATELGDAAIIRFTRGSGIPFTHFLRGRWDEALRAVEAFIAEAETGAGHRLLGGCYLLRALIRLGRDDTEAALADVERAGDVGRDDRHGRGVNAGLRAQIFLETGCRAEAIADAESALEIARREPFVVNPPLLHVFHRLGRGRDLLEIVQALPDTLNARGARLWASGDARAAADVYAALELLPTAEALARLAAGRDLAAADRHGEADVELLRAIELYRPVRARRYVAQAEALLSSQGAATAQPG
ncbi:MAG TPA: AAA family ATPase [Gaiellaceae bacterium]|nr:AAA family ATPase [Gaiellaceae bacterium]